MIKQVLILLLAISSFNATNNDYKYVWASRLNMRSSPGTNGEIISKLDRGQQVQIIGITDIKYEVTDSLFKYYTRFNKETKRLDEGMEFHTVKKFKGKWVKIKSNNQEGYVFDFYLSRLTPIPLFELAMGKELVPYLDAQPNYKKEQIGCKGCDDNYVRYTDEENEVIIELGLKQKCGSLEIHLKKASISEGELIGYSLFNNDISDNCDYFVVKEKGWIKVVYYCCC